MLRRVQHTLPRAHHRGRCLCILILLRCCDRYGATAGGRWSALRARSSPDSCDAVRRRCDRADQVEAAPARPCPEADGAWQSRRRTGAATGAATRSRARAGGGRPAASPIQLGAFVTRAAIPGGSGFAALSSTRHAVAEVVDTSDPFGTRARRRPKPAGWRSAKGARAGGSAEARRILNAPPAAASPHRPHPSGCPKPAPAIDNSGPNASTFPPVRSQRQIVAIWVIVRTSSAGRLECSMLLTRSSRWRG